MRWTERQRAMLEEMGLKLWLPAAPALQRSGSRTDAAAASDAGAGARIVSNAVGPAVDTRSDAPASSGIAAMTWGALRTAVAGCTACALSRSRRQTVFGVGNPGAHWMIVGEVPGEPEDIEGEPFVGRSGQLLDNMLRAVGLTRADGPPARQVFIANMLKCRPPGDRDPEAEELAQCEPFIARQLQLVRPRVIVAMGRIAVQVLLRSSEPIGRLRGRVHHHDGVPLIVTYHPAYLLRHLADKARAWDDLCLALATVQAADASSAA